MNIYFVTSYGNHWDGPDGDDTNFIIAAKTLESCIVDAERLLAFDDRLPDVIHLLGSNLEIEEATTIHGPWIAKSVVHGEFEAFHRELNWQAFSN